MTFSKSGDRWYLSPNIYASNSSIHPTTAARPIKQNPHSLAGDVGF